MNNITAYLFEFKRQSKEIKWFKNALALYLLYKVCVYVNLFSELLSTNRVIFQTVKSINFSVDCAFYFNNHHSQTFSIVLIILITTFSLIELVTKSNYLTRFLLWLIIVNFNNFLYPTLTAGDYLLNQLLFFNVFLTHKNTENKITNSLITVFHNVALIGIKLQICLVYALSAWFKLTDINWLSGSALNLIFQIPEYSNHYFSNLPNWLTIFSTYFVLSYQLFFSVFIWITKLKKYMLTIGIFQHLIISFVMGLFSFGMIMIISYILFLNYDYKSQKKLA